MAERVWKCVQFVVDVVRIRSVLVRYVTVAELAIAKYIEKNKKSC